MSAYSDFAIWGLICAIAAGAFALRFSFLGGMGTRRLPPRLERVLRYTTVAVLPALMAPLVLLPEPPATLPDPAKLAGACAALAVGALTRNVLLAIVAGVVTIGGLLVIA